MSLYEGAVKKPIDLPLLSGSGDLWPFLFVQVTYRLVSGY